ncbi:MAG: multicopper oxidase family protein [Firmicutes bacterium]|nr:multicopper oxidase family protein [Bacillota bacterium]
MQKFPRRWILWLAVAAMAGFVWAIRQSGDVQQPTAPATTGRTVAVRQPDPDEVPDGKTATIVAEETDWTVKPGLSFKAWTFNGTIPGTVLRVTEGDTVSVKLVNRLPVPVSIHWHGVPVPNAMDGVPGVTQNAVAPGKAFLYEFKATVPGTYWYHSHQTSAEQVDRGLYGVLIVEPKAPAVRADRDYTLVLDEWTSAPDAGGAGDGSSGMSGAGGMGGMSGMSGMSGMNHTGGMSMGDMNMNGMDMAMAAYTTFGINGKAYPDTDRLVVRKGERVRLRLVNAGFITHKIHIHGHDVRIVATDGQPIENPPAFRDRLIAVAPGERYDVEFVADNPGRWLIECHGDMAGTPDMKAEIVYEGSENAKADRPDDGVALPEIDLAGYAAAGSADGGAGEFAAFDREFDLKLGAEMRMGSSMGMVYTINGRTYPDTEPLRVRKGDRVKIRLENVSDVDHPMHLHGHFFQVLSKNGRPVTGVLRKDTLNVKPGEVYEIAFVADNPGNWMFHCHELHHAAAGMVTEVLYDGFQPAFTPDATMGNQPE